MIKYAVLFFTFYSLSFQLLGQNELGVVDLNEVEIIERKSKTKELGYHKQFTIETHVSRIEADHELALFIEKPKGSYLIKIFFAKIEANNLDSLKLQASIRKTDSLGLPGELIYVNEFVASKYFKDKYLEIYMLESLVKFPDEGIFISLVPIKYSEKSYPLKLHFSTKSKKEDSYIFSIENKWIKYWWSYTNNLHPKMGVEIMEY